MKKTKFPWNKLLWKKQKEDQFEREVFMVRCAENVCLVLVLLATRQNNFTHDAKPTRLLQDSSDVKSTRICYIQSICNKVGNLH